MLEDLDLRTLDAFEAIFGEETLLLLVFAKEITTCRGKICSVSLNIVYYQKHKTQYIDLFLWEIHILIKAGKWVDLLG
ncbi:hypothetical protein [Bacillus subtilis]|uniref:hypothetical protein n=1 Tax=Bacillus subtilis TaxID=1423 RepID=UPI00160103B1|nr:hypothetical protein [Bacillus subtilis]